jgi:hypothetical protein
VIQRWAITFGLVLVGTFSVLATALSGQFNQDGAMRVIVVGTVFVGVFAYPLAVAIDAALEQEEE